jgi:site-specific DNA-methyltransferase (adenine-specific)
MELELICGDVMDSLALVPDESVDIAITSPDYNLGIAYKSHQEVKRRDDYLAWACGWGQEVMRVLKPGGSFFLNISGAPSRPLLPHYIAMRFAEFAVLQNTFHWIKSITVEKDQEPLTVGENRMIEEISVGHFKPLTSDRYVNDFHEYVFHFSKTGHAALDRKAVGVKYVDPSNIKRWGHTKGANVRCRGNTWFVPYPTITNRAKDRPHPATFPAELAHLAYRITRCNDESVVLDPFVGIGNAGIAATWIPAAKFVGIDREQDYLSTAEKLILES